MPLPAHTTKVNGKGKLFRQGKEISTVLYSIAYDSAHSDRMISGLLKVIRGRTDLLGGGPLTLYLANGKQVNFGISTGNVRSFDFVMDI